MLAADPIVAVDDMARRSQASHEALQVLAPIEAGVVAVLHGPDLEQWAAIAVDLGRVDRSAAWCEDAHRFHHEVEPRIRRPEMLETARRPRNVEPSDVGRDRPHVDRSETHEFIELRRVAEVGSLHRLDGARVLAAVAPCAGVLGGLVGGEHR